MKRRFDSQETSAGAPRHDAKIVMADGADIDPNALDAVESLDDTVFAALSGDPRALDDARRRWQQAQHQVSPKLVDEARSHYIERAEQSWRDYRSGIVTDVVRAFAALDVMLMLEGAE